MSPHYSQQRKAWLLTLDEAVNALGVSRSTIKRALKKTGVYTELHAEKRDDGRGGKRVLYIDPYTLGLPMHHEPCSDLKGSPERFMDVSKVHRESSTFQREKTLVSDVSADLLKSSGEMSLTELQGSEILQGNTSSKSVSATFTPSDLEAAKSYHPKLQPILNAQHGKRGQAVKELAEVEGVSCRTIQRRVRAFEELGMAGLAQLLNRRPRADKGKRRLPFDLVQLIQAVWINNPPTISARKVHQIIHRAAPDLAVVERKNGRTIPVSVVSVERIRKEMEEDPTLRLLFMDADQRKEYNRTYSGQVLAAHANDMWQMDMTRCDIMIYDPEADSIYRPRVQAVIDVYSGCIMGISFSRRENQEQANLVLARALMTKQGPIADYWPMRGVAKRLYIDNGKTYKSDYFHDIVGRFGMTIIHSKPRVSHTRGKVERFFGTLHSLEKGLIGYCGENAVKRSNEELKVLYNKTLAWAREGKKVDKHQRLMTLGEYQNAVLKWLVADYHQQVIHKKTRMEHFMETVPAGSLVDFDINEFMLAFADWKERLVRNNGTIMIQNTAWTTPDGMLSQYQKQKLWVTSEPFALGESRLLAAYKDRAGRFRVVGELVPAPTVADSLEAAAQRKANKKAVTEQEKEAKRRFTELQNPALTLEAHLDRALDEVVVIEPALPAARAQLAAVTQTPLEQFTMPKPEDNSFATELIDPASSLDDLLAEIREENK